MRLLVGFAPGGVTDIMARLMGQWLSDRLGQQFFVENRTGAATNVATEAVVRAAPDGYTLLVSSAANAINATLYDNLNFDFIHDTVPIASIISTPLVMVVNPSFAARTARRSSPMPRITPAGSTWRHPAAEARPMSPANCSR